MKKIDISSHGILYEENGDFKLYLALVKIADSVDEMGVVGTKWDLRSCLSTDSMSASLSFGDQGGEVVAIFLASDALEALVKALKEPSSKRRGRGPYLLGKGNDLVV